jgi:hypothetical protein
VLHYIKRSDPQDSKKPWNPGKFTYICSKHFTTSSFIQHTSRTTLKKGAYPTIFSHSTPKPPPRTSLNTFIVAKNAIQITNTLKEQKKAVEKCEQREVRMKAELHRAKDDRARLSYELTLVKAAENRSRAKLEIVTHELRELKIINKELEAVLKRFSGKLCLLLIS